MSELIVNGMKQAVLNHVVQLNVPLLVSSILIAALQCHYPSRNNFPADGALPAQSDPHPPCPRNGRALRAQGQWQASSVFSRGKNLTSNTLIGALASVHCDAEGPVLWAQSVRNLLTRDRTTLEGNDLSSLILRCQSLSSKDVGCQFLHLLSTVQLAFKCQQ